MFSPPLKKSIVFLKYALKMDLVKGAWFDLYFFRAMYHKSHVPGIFMQSETWLFDFNISEIPGSKFNLLNPLQRLPSYQPSGNAPGSDTVQ